MRPLAIPRQDPRHRPVQAEIAARAPYGFFVGLGCGVGIGVRPTGGGVAPGIDGPPDGLADGFGANPQMFQLKRP